MSADRSSDKRISWLIGATLVNTVLSLGAIGLWFFAPNRNQHAPPGSSSPAAPEEAPVGARAVPNWNRFPRHSSGETASAPLPREMPSSENPLTPFDPRASLRGTNVNVAPSTQALADRLHLDPQVLTQTFGDESGVLPKKVTNGLEHAFDSASSLAKQRKLDEPHTQSVTAILTYYEFSLLREEKAAGAAPVDPTRVESIREEILDSIESTCGKEIRQAAEDEIERW